jgi:hypothetical protein
MNRLKRAAATLVAVTGISLVIGSTPAIALVTSSVTSSVTGVEHGGSPGVFHCC